MTSRWCVVVLRAIAVAVPAAAAVIGLAAPESVLLGGVAWLGFLLAVLAGWGHLMARAADVEVDLGMRLAWGAAGLLAVGGVALAVGHLDRHALAGLLVIGFLGHGWRQLTCEVPALVAFGRIGAEARKDPLAAVAWGVLIALALVNVLGAVASARANVYDDDIAYTPFVRRLLDIGDLDEPFSFRRMSAFGGQTVLSSLAAVRGTLANLYLVDHGVFQIITLALIVGMIRDRRADRFVGALAILVVLLLPDASINTASYWSGVALFLALYRTVAHVDAPPRVGFALAGLVAAATCTLRQNYLPVAIGFVGLTLVMRMRRPIVPSLRADRAAWLGALVGGLIGLVPYMVASWRSNQTVLYPLQPGTFNPDLPLAPTVWTAWQELQFFLGVVLEPDPLRITLPLLPILLVCRDRRAGRPLTALIVAAMVGFVMLCHAFSLADARNLWRYAFGYAVALVLIISLEATRRFDDDQDGSPPGPQVPVLGRFWIVVCLLAQLVVTSKSTARKYRAIGASLSAAAHGAHAERGVAASYRRLQAAVPAHAPLVVMLDQPAYLDYARNRIINLDTPGHASYPPGVPAFRGAEPVAAYFRDHQLRYLAFVRSDRSRYFYRRGFWIERLLTDVEIWRIVGSYMVDTIDNFAALADRYPVLFDEDGMVVLDLAAPRGAP